MDLPGCGFRCTTHSTSPRHRGDTSRCLRVRAHRDVQSGDEPGELAPILFQSHVLIDVVPVDALHKAGPITRLRFGELHVEDARPLVNTMGLAEHTVKGLAVLTRLVHEGSLYEV